MARSNRSPSVGPPMGRDRKVVPLTGLERVRHEPNDLLNRAKLASKHMKYFGLLAEKSSFSDLSPNAELADFVVLSEDPEHQEVTFRAASGEPDFTFTVSFQDPDRIAVVAEACAADILGVVLIKLSHRSSISVDTKPDLGNNELGSNALRFKSTLLMFPGFDDLPAWTKY
jgi:hypothetical protein